MSPLLSLEYSLSCFVYCRDFYLSHFCFPGKFSCNFFSSQNTVLSSNWLSLAGHFCRLTGVIIGTAAARAVCAVFSCVQKLVWLPVFGILTCARMLRQAIAHGGCTDSVRQSALKADFGSHRTGDSNPRQRCAWLFSQTLYPLATTKMICKSQIVTQTLTGFWSGWHFYWEVTLVFV